jgi:hypothetical protein
VIVTPLMLKAREELKAEVAYLAKTESNKSGLNVEQLWSQIDAGIWDDELGSILLDSNQRVPLRAPS